MSSVSSINVIHEWEKIGWKWHTIQEPKRSAFEIPANSVFVVPTARHAFKGEGILQDFSASFDSSLCGIRIRDGTLLDSKETWVIRDFMAIQYPVSEDFGVYVVSPPYTPYGVYYIHRAKDWYWKNWLELALINIDSESHWVLGYGYQIAHAEKRHYPEEKGQ